MWAVFTEVDVSESAASRAREALADVVVPRVKEDGATAGYWLAPEGGRGMSVVVFATEDEARARASQIKVGDAGPVPGVTFRTVAVCEVIAAL